MRGKRDWLYANGAKEVIKLKELDKLPDRRGAIYAKETGVQNTPDSIVDGEAVELKTITSKSGIKNRARHARYQAGTLLYDARSLGNAEADIINSMKNAVRDNGADLDRIVVITVNGTLLWERK